MQKTIFLLIVFIFISCAKELENHPLELEVVTNLDSLYQAGGENLAQEPSEFLEENHPKEDTDHEGHNHDDEPSEEFYMVEVTKTRSLEKARNKTEALLEKGYSAGFLWIPSYRSLSGEKKYSVYIGPFLTQQICEKAVEQYKQVDRSAYGWLVSEQPMQLEITGIGKVKKTLLE